MVEIKAGADVKDGTVGVYCSRMAEFSQCVHQLVGAYLGSSTQLADVKCMLAKLRNFEDADGMSTAEFKESNLVVLITKWRELCEFASKVDAIVEPQVVASEATAASLKEQVRTIAELRGGDMLKLGKDIAAGSAAFLKVSEYGMGDL